MIKLLHHTDIVPEVTMTFTMHHPNVSGVTHIFDELVTDRLETLRVVGTDVSPIDEVGNAIRGYLALHEDDLGRTAKDTVIAGYQPEKLGESHMKKLLLSLCSKGRFIPFIIAIDMEGIAEIKEGDMLYVLSGFGKQDKHNFLTLMVDLHSMKKELNLVAVEGSEDVHTIYPIMFDIQTKTIGSVLTSDTLSYHSYIMKLEDNIVKKESPKEITE